MNNKSIGLQILLWIEVIISVRILLFTTPVLINEHLNKTFSPVNINDWFIVVVTFVALLYMVAGIASIIGHKLWSFFHYLVMGMVLLLTAGIFQKSMFLKSSMSFIYFLPALFSILVTILMNCFKQKGQIV